ncbi:MAG TPA: response regulator [Candidatus Thermoplasmatota archaeon]|nr:response regulator [Candidatus Thermoplasmatota archaeon]
MHPNPLHVLQVDDDPEDIALVEKAFQAVAGTVRFTSLLDSTQVLPTLRSRPKSGLPDVILLDLHMPRMSGHEVLAELKKDPELAKIPVVVLTSVESERALARSHQLSAHSYISKPPDYQQLKAIIASLHRYLAQTVQLPEHEP